MDSITMIETSRLNKLESMIVDMVKRSAERDEELKRLKDNRLMDISEAMEHTGYGKTWFMAHKEDIGYHQVEGGPIKFYKEDLDKFFKAHKIQRKY